MDSDIIKDLASIDESSVGRQVNVTGKVTNLSESKYGNRSFWITDGKEERKVFISDISGHEELLKEAERVKIGQKRQIIGRVDEKQRIRPSVISLL